MTIEQAATKVWDAKVALDNVQLRLGVVRSEETKAINDLNNAQKEFDGIVAGFKERASTISSNWHSQRKESRVG